MPTKQQTQSALNAALLSAAEHGETDKVKEFLSKGADIHAKDNDKNTSLILAAIEGHIETAELLLTHGADPTSKTINGKTAEDLAKTYRHNKIADMLKNAAERIEISNNVDEHLAHQNRIHDALRRKDPLTMTDKEFLNSLEAEITNGK